MVGEHSFSKTISHGTGGHGSQSVTRFAFHQNPISHRTPSQPLRTFLIRSRTSLSCHPVQVAFTPEVSPKFIEIRDIDTLNAAMRRLRDTDPSDSSRSRPLRRSPTSDG